MAQPSTNTNSKSLKGREISMGESIIMPKDIKIDAITKSITKNGRKIKNPISKEVFNSEVINDGKTIDSGIALVFSKGPTQAISANIFMVSVRVFATINSFIKSVAIVSAI